MATKHTPGPWRWEVNERANQVHLCGGLRPKFDLTVMSFVRWGMQAAAPRFIDERGIMYRADAFLTTVPGREHHASWFKDIDHPDARLIAAAPELLEALKEVREWIDGWSPFVCDPEWADTESKMRAAIAKAEGRS